MRLRPQLVMVDADAIEGTGESAAEVQRCHSSVADIRQSWGRRTESGTAAAAAAVEGGALARGKGKRETS